MAYTNISFTLGEFTDSVVGGAIGDNSFAVGGVTFTIAASGNWTVDFSGDRFNFTEDPAFGAEQFLITATLTNGGQFRYNDFTAEYQGVPELYGNGFTSYLIIGGTSVPDATFAGTADYGSFGPETSYASSLQFRDIPGDTTGTNPTSTFWFDDFNVEAAPNAIPVARPDSLAAMEDTPVTYGALQLLANDTDSDGGGLSIASVSSVTGGAAILNQDGTVTFSPADDFVGSASFTYTVSDGQGGTSAPATVSINVSAVNDAPTATNLNQTKNFIEDAGGAIAIDDIVVSDPDLGETVTASLTLSNPVAGTLSTGTFGAATSTYNPGTGVWTVTGSVADVNAALAATSLSPATNFDQNFTIASQVRDAAGTGPADGSITVSATPVNDAPVITSNGGGATAAVDFAENATAVTVVMATDVDVGTTLTYSVTGPDAVLFQINASTGALTFRTAPDFETPRDVGADNIYDVTVAASDGTDSDTQALAITVTDMSDGGGGGTPTPPPSNEGTPGNDTIAGGTSIDPIVGGGGSDTITATPAAGTNAQVFGGSMVNDPNDGADNIIVTGQGGGSIYGNGGDDLIDYSATGAGSLYGGAGGDRISVTNDANNGIVGGKGGDTITVTGNGNNLIFGGNLVNDPDDGADRVTINGNGSNTVFTNGGDDVVQITGSGANTIYTGMGNDTIAGGSGNDTFIGGKGANVYTGGVGADTFVYTAGASDIITDFSVGQGDRLNLQGQEYSLTTASDGSAALVFSGGGVIILQGVTEAEFSGSYLV